MDKETQERWNQINRADCYSLAGQAVVYGLGGIEYEEVILTPDDQEYAGWITQVNTPIPTSLINRNLDKRFLRDRVEKIVRGMMAARIAENRFMTRFDKNWGLDWLEELIDEEADDYVKDYITLLSTGNYEEEIWAYARLLSVQSEIVVDEHWGTIKRVAQGIYRKHRVSRVEVEALRAG